MKMIENKRDCTFEILRPTEKGNTQEHVESYACELSACHAAPHTSGAGRKQNVAHVLGVDRDRLKLSGGVDEEVGPREIGGDTVRRRRGIGAQTNGRVQCVALTGQHNL